MKAALVLMDIYNRLFSFYGHQYWWPGDSPFEIAVGAILTQNTNWSNVEKAIGNLKKERLLNAKALYHLPTEKLASLIRPAGYYNIKAKRLKSFMNFLFDNYNGSMGKMQKEITSSLREKLLGVNGIGEETADSILLYAFQKPVFVIDAYTKRVFSRYGLIAYRASYEEYQKMFHQELDEDVQLFNEYHALLVRVGKEYCKSKPLCGECPLNGIV
jgi:endonuclease-3 related protein